MRCSASQTISTAVKPDERSVVRDQVNALLFAQVLKPLAASLGPLGDLTTDAVVQKLFVRSER